MTKNMKMCRSSSTVIGLPFRLVVQQRVWLLVFYSSEVDIYGQMLMTTDQITKI
jgi:hypothetical protein